MLSVTRIICFSLIVSQCVAQADSIVNNSRKRKMIVAGVSGGVAAGSLIYLQEVWYSGYNTGNFHFFNDNGEWQQMDKAGHFYSAYQIGRLSMDAFEWAGFSRRTERWVGGSLGLAYLTAVEIMDGYSEGWGFSWGDMLANTAGASLAITQEALWNEQRLFVKFSYFPSAVARHNPELLGETPLTRVLKDYNAQAYWLSFGAPLFKISNDRFPSWLLFSIGYSANGMTGAHSNTIRETKDSNGNTVTFNRHRYLLFSLDVDFSKIRTRSRFLKGLFSALNVVKVPFPSISISGNGVSGHLLR